MEDLKNQLEAILFSIGKKISIEELSRLCKITNQRIIESKLQELKQDYEQKESSLMLVSEKDNWKLTVRERHLSLVKNLAIDTELNKSVTETLAMIAFKYPVMQSDIIKIRSNKAYDHIKELEEMQFLEKVRNGRTYQIKLTKKFFEYFDLPEEKVKDQFKNFEDAEKVIEEKETEIIQQKKEIEQTIKEAKEKLSQKENETENEVPGE
jgi:segregation and condensation protein B